MNFFIKMLAVRKILVLIMAGICFAGVLTFLEIPRQEDPTLKVSFIRVVIPYQGATPEKIEKQVTRTMEEEIL